jgi:hypothetical protein
MNVKESSKSLEVHWRLKAKKYSSKERPRILKRELRRLYKYFCPFFTETEGGISLMRIVNKYVILFKF